MPEERLLATLDAILGNLIAAPKAQPAPAVAVDGPVSECAVAVEGMTCASCALLIEMKLKRDPRVRSASVNFAAATVTVLGVIDREGVFEVVRRLGYEARPMDTLSQRRLLVEREKSRVEEAKQRFVQAAILTLPVMVSGMMMHKSPALRVMEFALSSVILFGSSYSIFRKAWALAKQGEANMDTLIAIGSGAAWAYSIPGVFKLHHHVYFESAAGICTFVLLGRYMEERAKGKASEAIRKLIELQPETALRIEADGSEIEVAIDAVQIGDRLRVRAGDKIPTDGRLIDGGSSVSYRAAARLPVRRIHPGDARFPVGANASELRRDGFGRPVRRRQACGLRGPRGARCAIPRRAAGGSPRLRRQLQLPARAGRFRLRAVRLPRRHSSPRAISKPCAVSWIDVPRW